MPNTTKHYVHRVGRTARAGRAGRSVSLVGEEERKMLKEIVKAAKTPVKARILPQGMRQDKKESHGQGTWLYREETLKEVLNGKVDIKWVASASVHAGSFSDVILKFREKIENLEKDVYAVLCLEREEREMQQSEAQVGVLQNADLESIMRKEKVTLVCLACLLQKERW